MLQHPADSKNLLFTLSARKNGYIGITSCALLLGKKPLITFWPGISANSGSKQVTNGCNGNRRKWEKIKRDG